MRIGLTGGTGFIGRNLIEEYGSEYDFVVLTRRETFDGLSKKARYIHIEVDTDFAKIFEDCDAVIHLGGYVMHGMDESLHPEKYLENITLSEKVFDACQRLGIHNVINASSVAVYDQIDEQPVDEEGKCQPNSIYGVMKLAVEKIAEIYNRRFGMNIKSLRLSQGVGITEDMDEKSFWTMLLSNPSSGKPIPVYGEGVTGRDIIYVKDMVYGIICALRHPEEKGVFNIGTGRITSNMELAEVFCRQFPSNAGIVRLDCKESGIRTCMDISKAKRFLGYEPRYDLKKMAEEMCREYLRMIQ